MRIFFFALFFFAGPGLSAQPSNRLIEKAVQKVYNEYKVFFDSSLLGKYVIMDKDRSYLVNSGTQKLKAISRDDGSFAFDQFSLCFAFVYKGDTIMHLAPCRLDTFMNLMPLGTPGNPVRHGDILPPWLALVKGKVAFEYKELRQLLVKLNITASSVELQSSMAPGTNDGKPPRTEYLWVVHVSCPEIKCRELMISGTDGKVLIDRMPKSQAPAVQ